MMGKQETGSLLGGTPGGESCLLRQLSSGATPKETPEEANPVSVEAVEARIEEQATVVVEKDEKVSVVVEKDENVSVGGGDKKDEVAAVVKETTTRGKKSRVVLPVIEEEEAPRSPMHEVYKTGTLIGSPEDRAMGKRSLDPGSLLMEHSMEKHMKFEDALALGLANSLNTEEKDETSIYVPSDSQEDLIEIPGNAACSSMPPPRARKLPWDP